MTQSCVLSQIHFYLFGFGFGLGIVLVKISTANFVFCVYALVQLMAKSSEKPRLHQIPSEDMDSEDGGGTSPTEPAYQSRARAESLRDAEPIASKSQEEQMNLQHALILNQVGAL